MARRAESGTLSVRRFLEPVLAALDGAGIPYMIVGSVASSAHGAPRTTHDIDIVVELTEAALGRLLAALPDDEFYVSHEAAFQALRDRTQFNVIGMTTGWKADLIVRKQRPFSVREFARRESLTLFDMPVWTASAEDTALAKLEWSKMSGGSERQRRDVVGIVARSGVAFDLEYVHEWVAALGLEAEWSAVREVIDTSSG